MERQKEAPREQGPRLGRPRLTAAVATLFGLGIIGAIAAYLALSGNDSQQRVATSSPKRGIACHHLREASENNRDGNEIALRAAAQAAARAGEAALNRSGQLFGRPEEIALELEYAIMKPNASAAVISRLLRNARHVCMNLGQWPRTG